MIKVTDHVSAMAIPDPDIRDLVLERIAAIADDIPFDSTVHGFFVVVEAGDTLEAITAQVGLDPLSRTLEILEDCGTVWGCLYILDDSGYGVELFVPKTEGMPSELLAMCESYGGQS